MKIKGMPLEGIGSPLDYSDIRYCGTCKLPFYPLRRYQSNCLVCSALLAGRPIPKVKDLIAECMGCGKQFQRITYAHKFCSAKCRPERPLPSSKESSRFSILRRDDFQCFYCGQTPYEDRVKLHVDHVVPRAVGGRTIASNLVTACEACNLSKSATPIIMGLPRILEEISRRNRECKMNDDMTVKG